LDSAVQQCGSLCLGVTPVACDFMQGPDLKVSGLRVVDHLVPTTCLQHITLWSPVGNKVSITEQIHVPSHTGRRKLNIEYPNRCENLNIET
jgi:hypothetical protein